MNKTKQLIEKVNSKGNLSCYETERLANWYQSLNENNADEIYNKVVKLYSVDDVQSKSYCILF
jgi:hypothetical protein